MTAGGASSRNTRTYACAKDQLAFALSEPSAPMQTQAVGFVVYNTDRAHTFERVGPRDAAGAVAAVPEGGA